MARLQSALDALQVFLPGVFVVVVVWIGARYAVEGRITAGDLVAFHNYSAFLMIPLRTATEFANKLIRARVSAQRVCRVMALTSDHVDPPDPAASPAVGSTLRDLRTGLEVRGGSLVALVSDRPDESAAVAERLGLSAPEVDDDVLLGEVPLTALRRAIGTASADDILDGLPEGLETVVAERGRTFSGGQRQRLVRTRALALDPEVLVLVEPTSAVDAHTEARIAARLRAHRAGRTTVVTTTSPLLLDAVDEVAFLCGGRVVATGRHQDLLDASPAYRQVVTRESDPQDPHDEVEVRAVGGR